MSREIFMLKKGLPVLALIVTLMSGLTFTSAIAGEDQYMYRYLDDNGVITYSQTPPADGRESTKVLKASIPKYERTEFGDKKDWKEQEESMQRRLQAEKDKEAQIAEEKRIKEHNKQVCEQMRKNLAVLQTRTQVRRMVDGKRVMMTDKERQAMINEINKTLNSTCKEL